MFFIGGWYDCSILTEFLLFSMATSIVKSCTVQLLNGCQGKDFQNPSGSFKLSGGRRGPPLHPPNKIIKRFGPIVARLSENLKVSNPSDWVCNTNFVCQESIPNWNSQHIFNAAPCDDDGWDMLSWASETYAVLKRIWRGEWLMSSSWQVFKERQDMSTISIDTGFRHQEKQKR